MRGGRGSRGRGGKGRGEGNRTPGIETRSNSELEAGGVAAQLIDNAGGAVAGESPEEPSKEYTDQQLQKEDPNSIMEEELKSLKNQLNMLQSHIQQIGEDKFNETPKQPNSSKEQEEEDADEFPPLNNQQPSKAMADSGVAVQTPRENRMNLSITTVTSTMPSWRDKVTAPISPVGMPLKYVPPTIENGCQIVHIESHDVVDLVKVWERAVVVYIVGGNVSIDILRGFIRKHWSWVSMPAIHRHEEGYFILRFNTENECEEILKGGPYFLNRAPLIVKKWTINFDFKEEIMRVIPVWIRLPNLPLHCWGEDTPSRIVSAVGVPVIADECTAKQLKVSYARVLVEVDITQDLVKEITVRDSTGREFVQKAIPEWKPFYCRKCNKVGHDCKDTNIETQSQQHHKGSEGGNVNGTKKTWIPASIAKIVKGVTSLTELRSKLAVDMVEEQAGNREYDQETVGICEDHKGMQQTHSNKEEAAAGTHLHTATDTLCQQQHGEGRTHLDLGSSTAQQVNDEEGWTPVAPSKAARKMQHRGSLHTIAYSQEHMSSPQENTRAAASSTSETIPTLNRDGNPQIPSPK
ncbi:unnamed protein product [Amaranthus hypochondriacus]